MKQKELDKIIKLHEKWVIGNHDGKRANLSDTDLSDADLHNADLEGANLSDTNLRVANLGWVKWHETRGLKVYEAHLIEDKGEG